MTQWLLQTSSPSHTSSASWSLNGKWYYQWYAATANTIPGPDAYGEAAPGSICPKGWTIPLSDGNNANGSFDNIISIYGATVSSVTNALLYFNRNGYYCTGSVLNPTGGYYWSKVTSYNRNYAYYLNFYTYLGGSEQHPRWYGMSVRCLSLGAAG